MDVLECIKTRRSIRLYQKRDVPNHLIGLILDAATRAPSAGNLQPWEFIVVRDPERKEMLWRASLKQDHVKHAPVVIVVCANVKKVAARYGKRGERLYAIQDTAAAIQNMMLAAHAIGLGTCWVGAFDEEEVKVACSIPEHIRPVALITVGYPAEKSSEPPRVPFENLTWIDFYENSKEPWEFGLKSLDAYVRELQLSIERKFDEFSKKKKKSSFLDELKKKFSPSKKK
ncbi:MAG: nitroreductase family protein [Candidatus Aenigmarchaeota archaeon]|nr:nitroreductase family protein [Candidatus Aenigmarchaeota archaeon]